MNEVAFASVTLVIGVIFIVGGSIARNIEKKNWNDGVCDECGYEWRIFATDSQGGRMYECRRGHCCNISYRVDKNYKA